MKASELCVDVSCFERTLHLFLQLYFLACEMHVLACGRARRPCRAHHFTAAGRHAAVSGKLSQDFTHYDCMRKSAWESECYGCMHKLPCTPEHWNLSAMRS